MMDLVNQMGKGDTLLLDGPVRSGQKISYPGNLVIMGDVNAGAELVAYGNILVFGALRGMVHSGAVGKEDAVVLALSLLPTQLRIAGHITCPPEGYAEYAGRIPEIARIVGGEVVIGPFMTK